MTSNSHQEMFFFISQHTCTYNTFLNYGRKEVSIRSTPYCISQKNVVPLHGGIIILILRQEYAI